MTESLFPFAQYWWFYLAFSAFVMGILALDLGLFHRGHKEVSFKEATAWTCVWISLAMTFNYLLYLYSANTFAADPRLTSIPGFVPADAAKKVALQFLAGYIVEESLSMDNIFVFILIFRYFAIPAVYQHRILFLGIVGAIVFRGIFITIGAALIHYRWVVVVFGLFLVITGIKMLFAGDDKIDPSQNPLVKLLSKRFRITTTIHGPDFFVRTGSIVYATPLLVTLACIETTDILFAIDSVPAVFALTKEPLIVFTSNIFAILGLRSMYFMLAGAIDRFYLLKYGLALVLTFVGCKMLFLHHLWGGEFPITLSLAIIAALLGGSIVLSLIFPKRAEPLPAIEPAHGDSGQS
ncbi:MAG: TerC family protein [Acidimicrobiia bacterium]|nr:TerC family protein [Acidimicrobiia bacterium]